MDLYTWQVYREALNNYHTVSEVSDWLVDKRVVNWNLTLHDLIADRQAEALVIDVIDSGHVISRMEEEFMVMTNFPNCEYVGVDREEVNGVGADRYQIATRQIVENFEQFNIEHALETLELAVMESDDWATRCSTIYDPERGLIYIVLERNFSQVWQVSLEEETMTSWRGFSEEVRFPLGPEGIAAAAMQD